MRLSPRRQPLFDRPDPTPLAQAVRHDREDHEEAPAQAGDLGGDDGVIACDALEFLAEFALVKCFMPLAVSMIQSSIWIGGFWWAQKSSIAYIWFSTVCFPVLTLT